MQPDVVVIIPARFKSTRFPGKPLVLLKGIPMVIRVAQICRMAVGSENVYVATDSDKVADIVREHGYAAVMTSEENLTGTDRVAEAAERISADMYVNVQGDEPLIQPADIKKVIATKSEYPDLVINAMTEFDPGTDSANIPKVVATEDGNLLYISRSLIPGSKSRNPQCRFFKQVCIYAFTRDELSAFKTFGRKSILENIEDIEILRFFELGKGIKMVEVSDSSIAVDTPEDVEVVNRHLS